MRLRCMRQQSCANHRAWRSVVSIVSTGLLLTMTLFVDNRAPPMSGQVSWCGERACPPPGPGVAEVAIQAAPIPWQAVFGSHDLGARAGHEPEQARPVEDVGPRASGLLVWDRTGRPFSTTQIATAATTPQPTLAAPMRWTLTTTNPQMTLAVAAHEQTSGVLAVQITPSKGSDVSAIGVCLPAAPDEHFFGLGERFNGLDLTGQVVENWTQDQAWAHGRPTSYAPTPFLLSSRGYGLLLDTTAHATFDLRTTRRGCYHVRVDAPQLALALIAGPHPQTVIERHARLVGLPPLPPRWAFGVWKNLIGGTTRVEQDLARLQADGVPIDAIWIYDAVDDRAGFGWPWPIYGPIAPGVYPDLPCLIDRLQQRGFKVLGYTHPFVYPGSASFDEAQRQGLLVRTVDDQPYVEPWTYTRRAYVDFTKAQAVAWWQARVRFALTELGFDGAMLDFGEDAPVDGRYANGQPGALLHNQYPLLYHRAAYAAAQASKPGEAVFFARAGYSGSQPSTTGRFTGDQVRSWDRTRGLPAALAAMLSGGLSGWPYWGPDIAGFLDEYAVGAEEPPAAKALRLAAEKELWLRWVQLGALSPTMRDMLGMQRNPVGLWSDGETLAIFRAYARLHRALQPYLYHYAEQAHQRGLPILRPLFVNYPAETFTYTIADEYLVGDDLLVAPILQPGQTQRRLYLPDDPWRDYWTSQWYHGPGWVSVPAPLSQVPLFIRDGAALDLPALHTLGLPAHASAAHMPHATYRCRVPNDPLTDAYGTA